MSRYNVVTTYLSRNIFIQSKAYCCFSQDSWHQSFRWYQLMGSISREKACSGEQKIFYA